MSSHFDRFRLGVALALVGDANTPRQLGHELLAELRAKPVPKGGKPRVVLVPGIIGSSLLQGTRTVWLDPGAIALGGLRKLALETGQTDDEDRDTAEPPLRVGDPIEAAYGPMRDYLDHRGFTVEQFPFDWRRSMTSAARGLAAFLRTSQGPLAIVAHSMGCLVARLCLQQNRDLLDRLTRAVFIAPPFRGSFSPLMVAAGEHWANGLIQLLDVTHPNVAAACCTFPGLAQLIADEELDTESVVIEDGRPAQKFAHIHGPRWQKFCAQLRAPEAQPAQDNDARLMTTKATIILGTQRPTPIGARPRPSGQGWDFRFAEWGDDTVPTLSAWNQGTDHFRAYWSHSFMLAEPRVFTGVARLLESDGQKSYHLEPLGTTPPACVNKTPWDAPSLPAPVAYADFLLENTGSALSTLSGLLGSAGLVPQILEMFDGLLRREKTRDPRDMLDILDAMVAPFRAVAALTKPFAAPFTELAKPFAALNTSYVAHFPMNLETQVDPGPIPAPKADADPRAPTVDAVFAALQGNGAYDVRRRHTLAPAEGIALTPDLAAWPAGADPSTIPRWCAEILTPDRAAAVRRFMLPLLAQLGVRDLWLVDPQANLVEVFRARRGQIVFVEALPLDEPLQLAPFPGSISIEL